VTTAPLILIVEDEPHLAEGIAENLETEGYLVETIANGREALGRILEVDYDLVVLDVMLPELDGFAVCEQARDKGRDVPVLFLSAKDSVDDRIQGLALGGDDYLAKPFHLQELLLRVRAILRRRRWYEVMPFGGSVIRFGDNEFDLRTFEGRSWHGGEQTLTQKEAMILKALAERAGEVVSREEILDMVWGYDLYPSSRTIDNFIVRLRKRFEPNPQEPRYFHTVRGVGYRFTPQGVES
jgi:two-component system alkaline phosphatase synthesis response regulator PhoP